MATAASAARKPRSAAGAVGKEAGGHADRAGRSRPSSVSTPPSTRSQSVSGPAARETSAGSVVVSKTCAAAGGQGVHQEGIPFGVELAGDIVEEEQRRPAERGAHVLDLGDLPPQHHCPALSLRGVGPCAATTEGEGEVVGVRAHRGESSLAVAGESGHQRLAHRRFEALLGLVRDGSRDGRRCSPRPPPEAWRLPRMAATAAGPELGKQRPAPHHHPCSGARHGLVVGRDVVRRGPLLEQPIPALQRPLVGPVLAQVQPGSG